MLGLGLDDYGSDSDGERHSGSTSSRAVSLQPSKPPQKPSTSLTKPKRPPKKITIGLPALPTGPDNDVDEKPPPPKKPRLQQGAGSSSLLSMLPPPRQTQLAPKESVPSERVLGSGQGPGLVFNAARATATTNLSLPSSEIEPESDNATSDFFSLDPPLSIPSTLTIPSTSTATSTTLSSAPQVDEFIPPEPTPTDPYPGYYLLPSGSWAAYDPEYYRPFYEKWQKEYNAHIRGLEKGAVKGFEGLETTEAQEIDAQKEMEKAKREIQEREERKAVTKGNGDQPAAPRMNIQGAKLGARARSRHQLTTLLTEAYSNREALEEKIAEGRRNRKEAGNKYGF